MDIKIANADNEIMGCYEVLRQLRSDIKKEDFLPKIREHEEGGYKLAFCEEDGQVVTVAGFRFIETLAWGKIMYVDDLVTDENKRSKGYGDKIVDWLIDYAKENGCKQFHLDSAVWRYSAHRFYFRKRMEISCYHFSIEI